MYSVGFARARLISLIVACSRTERTAGLGATTVSVIGFFWRELVRFCARLACHTPNATIIKTNIFAFIERRSYSMAGVQSIASPCRIRGVLFTGTAGVPPAASAKREQDRNGLSSSLEDLNSSFCGNA